jgi:hypothetical protein
LISWLRMHFLKSVQRSVPREDSVEDNTKGSKKSRGRAKGKAKAKGDGNPNKFSHKNFIQASNRLSEAMKKDHESLLSNLLFLNDFHLILDFQDHSLLVFKSTENPVHRGHVTDTKCRPDITAAFVEHWGTDTTTIWPCLRLTGEDAS